MSGGSRGPISQQCGLWLPCPPVWSLGFVLTFWTEKSHLNVNMEVSQNRGVSPQIIHFNRGLYYKPSILGYPFFFLETPIWILDTYVTAYQWIWRVLVALMKELTLDWQESETRQTYFLHCMYILYIYIYKIEIYHVTLRIVFLKKYRVLQTRIVFSSRKSSVANLQDIFHECLVDFFRQLFFMPSQNPIFPCFP